METSNLVHGTEYVKSRQKELDELRSKSLKVKDLYNETRDMIELYTSEGDVDYVDELRKDLRSYIDELEVINSCIEELKQEIWDDGDDLFYVRHLETIQTSKG